MMLCTASTFFSSASTNRSRPAESTPSASGVLRGRLVFASASLTWQSTAAGTKRLNARRASDDIRRLENMETHANLPVAENRCRGSSTDRPVFLEVYDNASTG